MPPNSVPEYNPTNDFDPNLSAVEKQLLEDQIQEFKKTLSQAEQQCFDQGRRLSQQQRDFLLALLSEQEKSERGLRFADPPTETPPQAEQEAEARRRKVNVQALLMDLWDFADVLWLDLLSNLHSHGMNMGFSGDRTSIQRHSNAGLRPDQIDTNPS